MKSVSEEEKLKYFQFVHAAALQAIFCFSNLYGYAKDKSGPLKPGVETVEGTVKTVVRPVYDRFHEVPLELLKFVDRKVSQLTPLFMLYCSLYCHRVLPFCVVYLRSVNV